MDARAPFVPGLPPTHPTLASPEAEVKRAKYQHRNDQNGALGGRTLQLGEVSEVESTLTIEDPFPPAQGHVNETLLDGTQPQPVPPPSAPVPSDVETPKNVSGGSGPAAVYENGMYWKFLGSLKFFSESDILK